MARGRERHGPSDRQRAGTDARHRRSRPQHDPRRGATWSEQSAARAQRGVIRTSDPSHGLRGGATRSGRSAPWPERGVTSCKRPATSPSRRRDIVRAGRDMAHAGSGVTRGGARDGAATDEPAHAARRAGRPGECRRGPAPGPASCTPVRAHPDRPRQGVRADYSSPVNGFCMRTPRTI